MKRGDLVTVSMPGDFAKPRLVLVIQSDQFDMTATVTVLLLSSTLVYAPLIRQAVEATPENGLRKRSQIMIDKAMTVKRARLDKPFGHVDDDTMISVNRLLALFLGFAGG